MMIPSTDKLIAAGERALKRKTAPKKAKRKTKRKTKRKAKSRASRDTVVMSAATLARLRREMQSDVFGRPVRKKRRKKAKAKRRPAKKKTKRKAKAKRKPAKKKKLSKKAFLERMKKGRAAAARKRKR